MKAILVAQKEACRVISRQRLDTALSKIVPRSFAADIEISDEVLVYREKPTGKRIGPYVVREISGKLATLNTGSLIIIASIDKTKSYCQNHVSKNIVSSETSSTNGHETFQREKTQIEASLNLQKKVFNSQDTADVFIFK